LSSTSVPAPIPSSSTTARWVERSLYALLAGGVAFIIWFGVWQPITVLPRIRLAPGYLLTNPQGTAVTSEDLRGRFTLYTFSHSQCTAETCPSHTAQLAELHGWLAANAPADLPLSMVTISLAPAQDTADVLADHMAGKAAVLQGIPWHYLTGDPLRIRYVVGGGFKVYFSDEATGEPVRFDGRAVLVDDNGLIRAEYRAAVPDLDILSRDLNLLDGEHKNNSRLMALGYEAAHLFVCYP
jgi:protein SCO1